MDSLFSDRITDVPRSFIREILKVALDPDIISFAGGLPNRELFPDRELKAATDRVFEKHGKDIFQYSNSEGDIKLREYIVSRYKKKHINVLAENILITNGAQQGLDLLGKTLINDGDGVIIEEPGYLGAIQSFSIYRPNFFPVTLSKDGINIEQLKKIVSSGDHKLMYTVPNFQNPSGITYTGKNRIAVSEILKEKNVFLIEDDPYGDLRFSGVPHQSFKHLLPDQTILLGSFSKIVVPGFRIGWIVAPDHIQQKLLIAKQASDLHTCHFTQYIIYEYLMQNDIESHIKKVSQLYGKQCQAMLNSIRNFFPGNINYTEPEGGMFLWITLPQNLLAIDLFNIAIKEKVIFVPGDPFYINKMKTNTLRLNFSCVDENTIGIGIKKLANAINKLLENY